ncbi:putative conjugative transfer protein TraC [Orientia chuto str. Dubai]|uniref:Putative conjugative transfer protein TraC n=1 Tax=Orientia chuto str. Dubai TaxID=1359168 RepID=A0A0F3MJU2_9RICK|nr:putative conjugative transfer protein TraC [Orientia chuto str. Dubai]
MRANPKLAGFVDEDWKLLQSIYSNPPYYSEVAMYSPNVSGVIGRLMIDPFTLLLTSTNAKDYQVIEDHMAMGVSESINDILQERGIIQ